jgi:hypothetical protein
MIWAMLRENTKYLLQKQDNFEIASDQVSKRWILGKVSIIYSKEIILSTLTRKNKSFEINSLTDLFCWGNLDPQHNLEALETCLSLQRIGKYAKMLSAVF